MYLGGNMFHKLLFVTGVLAVSSVANAADNGLQQYGLSFSGNVALTSDYRFRGQTQTQNDPALQGTFTLAHDSGVYISVFSSNVDFGGVSPHLELDPSIGYTTKLPLSSTLQPVLDTGLAYYNYPSGHGLNYPEIYARLTFADAFVKGDSITPSIAYSNNYGGNSTKNSEGHRINNWNFNLAYAVPFADTGFGGVASVGYSKANHKIAVYGNDDNYIDWKAGVTYNVKSINGLTAELDAVGTNIDTAGYDHVAKRGVDTGAMFSLTKTF